MLSRAHTPVLSLRRCRRFLALIATAAVATPLWAPAAAAVPRADGGLFIRLLDASVARRDDPRARVYIDDHVAAGVSITRHVEVVNRTSAAVPLSFYAAPATIGQGTFVIGPRGATNDLVSWTSVAPAAGTLAPGQRQVLTVTIRVPRGVGSGERYGAVVADYEPPKSAGAIAQGARVGIRVYLSVGTGREPKSDFVVDTLTAARRPDRAPTVKALVHNTGARALDIAGSLKLTHGPGGLSAGPFPTELGTTLAPGQTEPVTIVLDKALPSGPWAARIDLQSGSLKRAAEGTITFPSRAGAIAAPVKAKNIPLGKNRHFLVPLALLLLLLLAIGFFLILWKRRRRDEELKEEATSLAAT